MSNKNKPCRFYQQGSCKFTEEECRFSHQLISTIDSNKDSDKQSKPDKTRIIADQIKYIPSTHKKDSYLHYLHKKNTESFEPNYNLPDMKVLVEVSKGKEKTNLSFSSRDVVVIPDLFSDQENNNIHDQLLKEMDQCGVKSDRLWKLWHGDTHMIADDSTHFKNKCPTFLKVLDKIRDYFGMDIKATRFNLYRDDKDFKPFHFDAAAVKQDKAKTQNITVGISFGRTREIAFEDSLEPKGHRRVIHFPMPNGYTYAFTKDINMNWRHGVPAIPPDQQSDSSRISIIAWGWIDGMK